MSFKAVNHLGRFPRQFHSIPESLLLIPRNSGIHFNDTCQFHAIPEPLELIPHPEFLTDTHTLPFAVCKQFRYPIADPELDGIRGNSAEFRPIPESPELIPDLEFSALLAV
jgi:hypothetical protein